MGRKTVIRRLAKYLPLSLEFQTAVALDNLAEAGKDQHLDAIDGELVLSEEALSEAMEDQSGENLSETPPPSYPETIEDDVGLPPDEEFITAMEADTQEERVNNLSDKPLSSARRSSSVPSSKVNSTNTSEV